MQHADFSFFFSTGRPFFASAKNSLPKLVQFSYNLSDRGKVPYRHGEMRCPHYLIHITDKSFSLSTFGEVLNAFSAHL